ncbi:MAG TPA: M56 family metallopeptidase, partial [Chitinophagaceae bacterium]|nr:M56 family metallopeptidase [Chitinophagaceae bacterium]
SGQVRGNMITDLVAFIGDHSAPIVLAWFIFFAFKCLRLCAGLSGISRIRRNESTALPGEWIARLQELSARLRMSSNVRVLQSRLVKVPVAVGFFKPVIFIPLGLLAQLPPGQVETILLHELAHIRRKDFAINLIQRIIEALFFFNPGILWISSLLRREREAACDDIVVANTAHRETYLEALISFQERQLSANGFAMALGTRRNYLLNRVRRMLTRENEKLNVMEKMFLFAGLAVMTAFTFIPSKPAEPSILNSPVAVVKTDIAPAKMTIVDMKPVAPITKARRVSHEKNPVDTVPSPKTQSDLDDLKIDGLSNYVNDDGETRMEALTVTDYKGKRYVITKVNNKMTDFTIDGKSVPESEWTNYSGFFQKVELAVQVRKENTRRMVEDRKQGLRERQREMEQRQIEMKAMQKERMSDRDSRSEEMNMKTHQRKMKLLEAERGRIDRQRKQEQQRGDDFQMRERKQSVRETDEPRMKVLKEKIDRQVKQEKQDERNFRERDREQLEQKRDQLERERDERKMEMKFRRDTAGPLESKRKLFGQRQSDLKKESFLDDQRSDRSIFTKKMQLMRKDLEIQKKKLLEDKRVVNKNEKTINTNLNKKFLDLNASDKKYTLLSKPDTKLEKIDVKENASKFSKEE